MKVIYLNVLSSVSLQGIISVDSYYLVQGLHRIKVPGLWNQFGTMFFYLFTINDRMDILQKHLGTQSVNIIKNDNL